MLKLEEWVNFETDVFERGNNNISTCILLLLVWKDFFSYNLFEMK